MAGMSPRRALPWFWFERSLVMSTSKSISKSTVKKTVTAAPSPSEIGLAKPDASAPVAPMAPQPTVQHPRVIVLDGHVANAVAAAAEIEASASYAHDFGKCGPDPTSVVEGLRVAHAWSEEQTRADAWREYVLHQREQAWSIVMAALAPLIAGFAGAAQRDPSIVTRYPALATFVGTRTAQANRNAATRRRNAKAKARKAASEKEANATAATVATPPKPANNNAA
jgi:hypothetical protein